MKDIRDLVKQITNGQLYNARKTLSNVVKDSINNVKNDAYNKADKNFQKR